MRKLCTKWFAKWSEKAKLSNEDLLEAVNNLEKGLSAIRLSRSLLKIRIKRAGKGKSSGFRTIVVFQNNDKAIFLYGFAKNERSNISKAELESFKKLSKDLLQLDSNQITNLIKKKILFDLEVKK